MRRNFIHIFPILLCSVLSLSAHATSYIQIGVTSRIGVAGECVYFVQADGSLTFLNRRNGTVIERRKTRFSTSSFWSGGEVALPSPKAIPPSYSDSIATTSEPTMAWISRYEADFYPKHDHLACSLTLGTLRIYRAISHKSPHVFNLFEYRDAGGIRWRGYFPEDDRWIVRREISAATETADQLLLGFNDGLVICLDRQSGIAQWIYLFPYQHGRLEPVHADFNEPPGWTRLPTWGNYTTFAGVDGSGRSSPIDELRAEEIVQFPRIVVDHVPVQAPWKPIIGWAILTGIIAKLYFMGRSRAMRRGETEWFE